MQVRVSLRLVPALFGMRNLCASAGYVLNYHIVSPLHRRLVKIEARHPAQGPVHLIDANPLDPELLAPWLAVDINQMTLSQLDLLG